MIDDNGERTGKIGVDMDAEVKVNLITSLSKNADVFAFSAD